MKKTLILETYPFQPHLEIAGEIALTEKKKYKNDVYFSWLGENLNWAEWHLPIYKKIFYSYDHRIKKFLSILEQNNINIIESHNIIVSNQKILKWAKSFKGDIYDLKNFKFRSSNIGLGVASSVISYVQESNPDLNQYRKLIINSLMDSARIYIITQNLIKKIKPKKIITFNGRFATANAISMAARKLNVEINYHERGSQYDKYEVYNDTLHSSSFAKKLIKIHWKKNNKDKYKIAKKFYLHNRSGKRQNMLGLKFKKYPNAPDIENKTNSKIYTYFASTSYEWDAIFGFKKGNWKNEFEAIKKLALIIKRIRKDIKLIIRLHPYNKLLKNNNDINKIKKLARENNILIYDEFSKVNSYKLIQVSDVVISYGSTIGAEAVYMNKPSIILRDCAYI